MKRNEIEVGGVYAREGRFGSFEPVVVLSTEKFAKARPYHSWSTDAVASEKGTGILVAALPMRHYPSRIDGDVDALVAEKIATFEKERKVRGDGTLFGEQPFGEFCTLNKITETWDAYLVRKEAEDAQMAEQQRAREEWKAQAKVEAERKAEVAATLNARLEGTGLEVVVKDGKFTVTGDEDAISGLVDEITEFGTVTR